MIRASHVVFLGLLVLGVVLLGPREGAAAEESYPFLCAEPPARVLGRVGNEGRDGRDGDAGPPLPPQVQLEAHELQFREHHRHEVEVLTNEGPCVVAVAKRQCFRSPCQNLSSASR